ncbi:bifunctional chorismate mutase/prephenate dehydrogenase [Neiella sp. HB171785]|uniref:T-protein n=1 Tax=Neiella litorisoli TaxID=2771431 RepID=A0A8J6ULL4_9GAMM|nr:bifunctional chorismate mutase/prephenate dehydrogenase [Neiella litorisoli]MBD1389190.1 bifunctional chorismate mutase/prephenate dehydrogenase [Neiella litorisoli]
MNISSANLDELRDQIDATDQALLSLLKQRLALVHAVGEYKSQHGLPVYVPEREAAMLAKRRAEAENLGVPPDLIEDVLRRAMRESYSSENDAGFKQVNPQAGDIVVVGGNGKLGRLFVNMFRLSGYSVKVLGRQDWDQAEQIVANASLVVVSVPIDSTEQTIARLPKLPADCILTDLTSVKQAPMKAMLAAHDGPVVGLHPMFGPDIKSFAKQVIIYCDGRGAEQYQWLLQQMQLWGPRLHESTGKEHDETMSMVQALRHFTSFAYGMHLQNEDADLGRLLAFSSPIYRLELAMVGRLFAQDGELYASIITAAPENIKMFKRYLRNFSAALTLLEQGEREAFVEKFNEVAQWFGDFATQFQRESRDLLLAAHDRVTHE